MAQQTVEILGQLVKKKYPGDYDDIPDAELGSKIKLKYPNDYSDFSDLPPRPEVTSKIQTPETKLSPIADTASVIQKPQLTKNTDLSEIGMSAVAPALAGAGAAALGGSPLVISAVMPLVENLLRAKYSNNPEDAQVLGSPVSSAIKNLSEFGSNEIGGNVIDLIHKLPLGLANLSQMLKLNPEENKLGLTFGQRTGSRAAKLIEDVFAPGTKEASIKETNKIGKNLIEQQASQIAGNPVTLEDYALLSGASSNKLSANYYATARASTAKGNFVQAIADSNPVPIYKQAKVPVLGPLGQPISSTTKQVLDKTISGPTQLTRAISNAKEVVDQITPEATRDTLVRIVGDNQYSILQRTSAAILQHTNAEFDKTGKLITYDPVSFKNAWQWQKDLGNYTAKAFETGQLNFNKTQLNNLHSALGDDISDSVPSWQNNGSQALKLWNESKALVKERMDSFFPKDQKLSVGDVVLGNENNIKDKWNAIINDNHALAKTLKAGELPLAQQEGITVNNPRKELAAFKFADMWNNAYVQDAKGNIKFDVTKFLNQFRDINFSQSENKLIPASKDLLYSNGTQQDIERFAQALGKASDTGATGPSRYLALRLGTAGIGLSAGLATGLLSGQDKVTTGEMMGIGILGATLSLHELGKLLINKDTARVLVAMAEGSALGMSDRLASRVLAQGLRNMPIKFNTQNGDLTGKFNSQGTFQVLGQPGNEIKIK